MIEDEVKVIEHRYYGSAKFGLCTDMEMSCIELSAIRASSSMKQEV
jgi:hypothetical protein